MFGYNLAFDSPWYLWILVLLPGLWLLSYRSLSGLGPVRRIVALLVRSLVVLLVVLALAELQFVQTSDRMTVIYLLDQSDSVPLATREKMMEYVQESWRKHRDHDRKDRAAVVVFGRNADVEIGPLDDDPPPLSTIETVSDREFTNLASAMQLAISLFPEDTAKRIVVITDGNENLGDARRQAAALATSGVSIDVLPVSIGQQVDISVEKVTIPSNVRRGQPFDLRVVLASNAPEGSDPISGKLKISRQSSLGEQLIAESDLQLPPGKTVITPEVPETIEEPDFYTYKAVFTADDAQIDSQKRNNRATTFTHVKGRGRVLLIEDWEQPGNFDELVTSLRRENLSVTLMPSNELFSNLAELQRYDTVVLANVPRASGDDVSDVTHFSDAQIDMLVRNTQQMGAGLVMIGGENSFGAGGWSNTELEKAMPVDFQIKNKKIVAVGALCLIMHAGEMPRGNHWQRVIAREAIKALGDQDYCGLIHFDGAGFGQGQQGGFQGNSWLWKDKKGIGLIPVSGNRKKMLAKLDKMTPGDMPDFDPGLRLAAIDFAKVSTSVRHMIIISDGDPAPATPGALNALIKLGVKVTTVAVGSHGFLGHKELARIAKQTGGKYYKVKNAKALPRIYQREVRRLARSLIHENDQGMQPRKVGQHEMLQGIDAPPPITGYVLTTLKDSPLIDVSLRAPEPVGDDNNTLLASWTYGLGRAVAFTTDAGQRWTGNWTGWDNYQQLFTKMIRWSMRPVEENDTFIVSTDVKNGKVNVVITAWDEDENTINYLTPVGSIVGPDMKDRPITIHQTAPGRYVGQFDATDSGSYFLAISPGEGRAPIRSGVSVPYSSEYRYRDTNLTLLQELADKVPEGGSEGQLIQDESQSGLLTNLDELLVTPIFRHDLPKARSSQPIWHLLLLIAACLFFFDVFIRRVQVNFTWVTPIVGSVRNKLLRREPAPPQDETMSRLRNLKAEIVGDIEQRKAATRFEPAPDADAAKDHLASDSASPTSESQSKTDTQKLSPDKNEDEDSYTSRLLKAKKDALKNRKQ